jgi:hypothetical protein
MWQAISRPLVRLVATLAIAGALVGCATPTGGNGGSGIGRLPSIKCKGKAAITGQGQLTGSVGAGAAAGNSWSAQFDCGDGFELDVSAPTVAPAPGVQP